VRSRIRPDRIHGSLYRDANVFERELERIWHRTWVYLGHESELPRPGDYLRRAIGRQPLLLVRDEGRIRAFYNRCRHRANLVCHLDRGNAKTLVCPYHGWAYGPDGHLVGRTFEDAYAAAPPVDEFGLTPIPRFESYRGLLFGSLCETGVSLEQHLGRAREYLDLIIDRAPDGEVQLSAGVQKTRYSGNWKMLPENSLEGAYHGHFIHKFTFAMTDKRIGRNRAVTHPDSVRYLAGGHMVEDFRKVELSKPVARTPAHQAYIDSLIAAHGERRVAEILGGRTPMIYVFPNLIYIQTHFRRLHPVGPGETHVYYHPALLKGASAEINEELLRHHESYFGPAGFLSADDLDVMERSQEAVEATGDEWLYIGRGLHRERADADGTTYGTTMDENHLRGMWSHYAALMDGN
jgi:fatty-acyl-CoA synthase